MGIEAAAGNAMAGAAGNAASSGIMSSISKLFGPDSAIMKILGSEGMSNLITGGSALWEGLKTGEMMDFQMDQATKAGERTQGMYDESMAKSANQRGAFDDIKAINFDS